MEMLPVRPVFLNPEMQVMENQRGVDAALFRNLRIQHMVGHFRRLLSQNPPPVSLSLIRAHPAGRVRIRSQ